MGSSKAMGGGASKAVYSRTQGDDKGLDMVCDCVGADEATVIKFCEDFKKCDSSGDGASRARAPSALPSFRTVSCDRETPLSQAP